ncbi:hypothetical protein [Rhodococcus koreensis]
MSEGAQYPADRDEVGNPEGEYQATEVEPIGEQITVANEFTGVIVQKVRTRTGERLSIRAPKQERGIRLDAMQLEILTSVTHERFTEMFARKFGSHEGHP